MSSALLISDAAKRVKVEAHVLRYWEEELGLPIKRNELGHRYYTEEDVKRFQEIKDLKERGLQLKAIRMVLKNGKLDMITPAGVAGAEEEKPRKSAEIIKEFPSMKQTELLKEDKKAENGQNVKQTEAETVVRQQGKVQIQAVKREKPEEKTEKQQELKRVTGEAEVVEEIPAVEARQETLPAEQNQSSLQGESNEEKFKRLQWLLKQLFKDTLQENNEHLCREMKESVLKEMDYQFRMQEEREEERSKEKVKREEEHYKKIDDLLRKKRRLLKK